MNSLIELQDKWKEINTNIKALVEERRIVRKEMKQMGFSLKRRPKDRIKVARIKDPLKNKERDEKIISLFKQGKTLQEIGEVMGFTREYARQILKNNGLTRNDGGQSVKEKQKNCLVDGCLKEGPFSLGYCIKHYSKFKKYGDPLATTKHDHPPICSVEGCLRPYKSNGYCNTHRSRWYLKGDAGEAAIISPGKHINRGHQNKLTDAQKEEIRSLYVRGTSFKKSEFSTTSLGKMFGVSSAHISRIVNNKI